MPPEEQKTKRSKGAQGQLEFKDISRVFVVESTDEDDEEHGREGAQFKRRSLVQCAPLCEKRPSLPASDRAIFRGTVPFALALGMPVRRRFARCTFVQTPPTRCLDS